MSKKQQHQSLRLALIEAQYALREQANQPDGRGVLVLVSGVELAGKGEALTQLREWMDPRLLKVSAHLPRKQNWQRPFWLPYVNDLPARGEMVVLFGNWYGDLLAAKMSSHEQMSDAEFAQQVADLQQFEQYLAQSGVTVIKCWFDLPWSALQHRLDALDPTLLKWQQLHGLDWRSYAEYQQIEQLRQQLGKGWVDIDGQDADQRDLDFAHQVLAALTGIQPNKTDTLGNAIETAESVDVWQSSAVPLVLASPDQGSIEKEVYKARLKKVQRKLAKRIRKRGQRPLIVVFEGMDAAGKGGSIRRVVAPLDPREYQIYSIAAPDAVESRHAYLWRFWTRLPDRGGMAIFDRSWYGRVLVERIEGFAREAEWQRAYDEINQFERQCVDAGAIVIKFWLAIDADEQLQRFEDRAQTPHKHFKLTEDDWRNRKHWDAYVQAASDLLARTHSPDAPWVVVATNDKYQARLQVLEGLNDHLKRVLSKD